MSDLAAKINRIAADLAEALSDAEATAGDLSALAHALRGTQAAILEALCFLPDRGFASAVISPADIKGAVVVVSDERVVPESRSLPIGVARSVPDEDGYVTVDLDLGEYMRQRAGGYSEDGPVFKRGWLDGCMADLPEDVDAAAVLPDGRSVPYRARKETSDD